MWLTYIYSFFIDSKSHGSGGRISISGHSKPKRHEPLKHLDRRATMTISHRRSPIKRKTISNSSRSTSKVEENEHKKRKTINSSSSSSTKTKVIGLPDNGDDTNIHINIVNDKYKDKEDDDVVEEEAEEGEKREEKASNNEKVEEIALDIIDEIEKGEKCYNSLYDDSISEESIYQDDDDKETRKSTKKSRIITHIVDINEDIYHGL